MFPADFKEKAIEYLGRGNIYRYYVLNDSTGGARDYSPHHEAGTYNGPTLVDDIMKDGTPTPTFDGTNDEVNCDTNLATDIGSPQNGSVIVHGFGPSGVWSDATTRYLTNFQSTTVENRVRIFKTSTTDEIRGNFRIGTSNFNYNHAMTTGEKGDWFQWITSWDSAGDTSVRHFVNGVLKSTQTLSTTWDDDVANFDIGSLGTSLPWSGSLSHVIVTSVQCQVADAEFLARAARIIP